MSKLIYLNRGGRELHNPTKRDTELLSRREAIRRASVFLPLAFFLGSRVRSAANSTIISRTISAANQNAISMVNATWARPVTLPVGWNKIRLGARMHMTSNAVSLTATPIFTMGFCSGTTNQYGDATTTHFVGMATEAATWNYGGAPTPNFSMSQQIGRVRIGTTNTNSPQLNGNATQVINANAGANGADREIVFLDIFHGSPNYTFHMPFNSSQTTGLLADVSASQFLFYMGLLNPVPTEGNYVVVPSDQTLAVNEALNGTLNAINLYWNRPDVAFEICDIAVAVLA